MSTLLIVDDDAETVRFMEELLAEPGRQILSAGTPDRALALGPDGALWAAATGGAARIDPQGATTFVNDVIDPAAHGLAITAGPDGRMWMTLDRALKVLCGVLLKFEWNEVYGMNDKVAKSYCCTVSQWP